MTKQPTSLETLKKTRQPVRNANVEHAESLSFLERLAVWIADSVGSVGFFSLILIWTIAWFGWNIFAPAAERFDAFPSFVLWLFIANVLQLFLMPLIMIGQNLESRHSETRAEADFELSVKTEKGTEVILEHLEYQNDLILKVLKHLEKEYKEESVIPH